MRTHQLARGRRSPGNGFAVRAVLLAMLTLAMSCTGPAVFAQEESAEGGSIQPISIDGRNGGRMYDGIGGVSAGASTRLLIDYPELERSQILDFLFKPNYGIQTQVLKVEIGGDMNATSGSEASHMRSRDEVRCDTGYEWWLMHEAKKRNPDIILAGLQWGSAGWIEGGFWSQDNIDYIIKWLDCAEEQGLDIEYVGGWNESGYEARWFVLLDEALKEHHPAVKIIAPDDLPHHNWRIAKVMAADLEVNAAIDVLGQHSPGTWRSLYQKFVAPPEALRLGKPLWASEMSALSHDVGGRSWARAFNRAYIDAKITSLMNWAPVAAWYPNLPHADTGLVLAEWPWSGYYAVSNNAWAAAHTAQFAQPGWNYIDSACGYLETGASYVTLKSPDGRQFSTIIETLDAEEVSGVQFTLTGGLEADAIYVWKTDPISVDPDEHFIKQDSIRVRDGVYTVMLEPGKVYSLTNTTGQSKGSAAPKADVYEQMPLPYEEDFEGYEAGKLARYFSDLNGGFETAPAAGGREGMAYRQVVPQQPIVWNLAGAGGFAPTTMIGDVRWWGDYEVSADFFLEQPGSIELMGRISSQHGRYMAGYHLEVSTEGTWRLYRQSLRSVSQEIVELASGQASFAVGQWQQAALRMTADRFDIIVNGKVVGTARDWGSRTGNVAIRTSPWQHAQFDNFKVTPTAAAPAFLPQARMTATATSERDFWRGDVYRPDYVIDGRPESHWHSAGDAPLPQAITIDLGRRYDDVRALTYQPRIDDVRNGMITRYNVYLSLDGRDFKQVASGEWPADTATKVANWSAQQGHYLRLEAVEGIDNVASAAEINVATSPIAAP